MAIKGLQNIVRVNESSSYRNTECFVSSRYRVFELLNRVKYFLLISSLDYKFILYSLESFTRPNIREMFLREFRE